MVRLMVMYVRSTDRALDAIAWWPLLMTTAINLRASAASAAARTYTEINIKRTYYNKIYQNIKVFSHIFKTPINDFPFHLYQSVLILTSSQVF